MYAFHTSRNQAKLFSTEYAIGDPFGYGKKNDIGSVLGAVAGPIVSGIFGNEAANTQQQAAQQAANTSGAATERALQLQQQMYEQQRADQTPWRQQGGEAVNMLSRQMGLGSGIDVNAYLRANPDVYAAAVKAGGDPAQFAIQHYREHGQFEGRQGLGEGFGNLTKQFGVSDFQQDPGYGFRLSEGLKAMKARQAAGGQGLMGANTMKGLQDYGQQAASQEYQNAFNRYQSNQQNLYNRLAGIAGTGQTASNALAQAGSNYAGNAGNLIMGNAANQGNALLAAGQARASSYGGMGSALGGTNFGNLFGGGANSYSNYDTGWAPYQSGPGAGYIDPYYGDGNGSGF